MNENRLEQYEETNKNITFWTISILLIFSFPILIVLWLQHVRNEVIVDFNSNKTLICDTINLKIEVSKSDNWYLNDSYYFVKGPTKLIISKCKTKE